MSPRVYPSVDTTMDGARLMAAASGDVFGARDNALLTDVLTDAERERVAGFRFPRQREDYVAAHVLVRRCAGALLDTDPGELTLAQECATCGGPHGRPRIVEAPRVWLSLSHTRGYVAAIAGHGPVGVDVEVVGRGRYDPRLARRVLAPAEVTVVQAAADPALAFLRLWVRKESLVKMGEASLDELGSVDLSALPLREPDGSYGWSSLRRGPDQRLREWAGSGVIGTAIAAV